MQDNKDLSTADTAPASEKNTTEPVTKANRIKAQAAKIPDKKQAFMYLGPNIPGGILLKGALFKGKIPVHLDGIIEKIPEIKKLLVEAQEVANIKSQLEKPGSAVYGIYQYVQEQIKEGVLKDGI